MTTRELINRVLRELRQFSMLVDSGTSTIDDDYLLMILQFINTAKEETEEAGWAWQALRQTVTITLSAGTVEYDLTIAGAADVDTNDRTRLLYESRDYSESFRRGACETPQMWDVTDSSEHRLREVSQEKMERWHMTDDNETGEPMWFAIWIDGDSVRMKVYPIPDQAYTLKGRFYIPQAELEADSLDTTLSIPSRPVWLRAAFKANQERGSELGQPDGALARAVDDAHGAAVAAEMTAADETVTLAR